MSNGCASGMATFFAWCAMMGSCSGPSTSDIKALEQKIDALNGSCRAAPTVYHSQPAASAPRVLTARTAAPG